MNAQLSAIEFQIACFKELANCIIWLMQDMDQPNIKILTKEGMQHGSILNQKIRVSKSFADEINADPSKLALLIDITSIAGVGDGGGGTGAPMDSTNGKWER